MAAWLRECNKFKWLCATLASAFEDLGNFLIKIHNIAVEQLKTA